MPRAPLQGGRKSARLVKRASRASLPGRAGAFDEERAQSDAAPLITITLPMTSGGAHSSPARHHLLRPKLLPLESALATSARPEKRASRFSLTKGVLYTLLPLLATATFFAGSSYPAHYAQLFLSRYVWPAAPPLPPPPQRTSLALSDWIVAEPERSCLAAIGAASRAPSRSAATRSEDARAARCCIRRLRHTLPLVLTAADATALQDKGFSEFFTRTLPHGEGAGLSPGTYATCAVVSNAPSLRLRDFGTDIAAEIDASDGVFRINLAPVKGFEKWVGSRTTHRILNTHKGVRTSSIAKEEYKHPDRTVIIRDAVYFRKQTANLSESWNTRQLGNRLGMLDDYRNLRRSFGAARIFLNHPVFTELSLRHMHMGLHGGRDQSLSSGAQAVLLAMTLCDRVTSFEVASSDPLSRKHKYYYNTEKAGPYNWWHPFEEESGLLRMLASNIRNDTSIFEYDMTEGANSCDANDAN